MERPITCAHAREAAPGRQAAAKRWAHLDYFQSILRNRVHEEHVRIDDHDDRLGHGRVGVHQPVVQACTVAAVSAFTKWRAPMGLLIQGNSRAPSNEGVTCSLKRGCALFFSSSKGTVSSARPAPLRVSSRAHASAQETRLLGA